jgi:hypothetical protein
MEIAAARDPAPDEDLMNKPELPSRRRILWGNVLTVFSAAILIGAEVFGAAYAGGWALAVLFGLDEIGVYVLQALLFIGGVAVMASFVRAAQRVEPFTAPA